MTEVRALIFDVDGTLAETEELHRQAFNSAFRSAGLDISWDQARYRELLAVAGGKRRILKSFEDAGLPADVDLADKLHAAEGRFYAEAVDAGIELRPGVRDLLQRASAAGLRLAIATTSSRRSLSALLAAFSLPLFDVIVTGDDVATLKPDPAVYLVALQRLDLPAEAALAFEDSANGLAAAAGAGIRTIVTPAFYTTGQDFAAAAKVLPDLAGFDWHQFE